MLVDKLLPVQLPTHAVASFFSSAFLGYVINYAHFFPHQANANQCATVFNDTLSARDLTCTIYVHHVCPTLPTALR
jgi:hypothetical protein